MGQTQCQTPSRGDDDILILEVLGCGVNSREWRLGDWWTRGVLGLSRPYIMVNFRGTTHCSDVVEMREETSTNFNLHMALPLVSREETERDDSARSSGDVDDSVFISVRDRRYVQALMRGDPLVGEATLKLALDGPTQVQARLELRRPGHEEVAGWVHVQYWVVEPQQLRRILAVPGEHPLREVVKAVTDHLRTDEGKDLFFASKPFPDGVTSKASTPLTPKCMVEASRKGREREKLDKLVEALYAAVVDGTSSETSDEDTMKRMGSVARDVLIFVADTAWQEGTGEFSDTMALAMQWAKKFFGSLQSGEELQPSLARFAQFLTLVTLKGEDLAPVTAKGQLVGRWTPGSKVPPEAVLGTGSYGAVWRARDKETKQLFAVKQMPLAGSGVASAISRRELTVAEHLRAVSHPCVVRLWNVYEHRASSSCSLVMEYCACGDLQGQIEKAKVDLGYEVPRLALHWTGEIFLGLEYLHQSIRMLVRDVKPQNVVLAQGLHAKLTDFGMSRLAASSDGTFSFHPCVPPGSPHYVAPEVLWGIGYDYHADLYSWAVLVWVLFTGGFVGAKTPLPPCARAAPGREGLLKLVNNWKLLEEAIKEPKKVGAPPLPSESAKDFVLRLTDRSEDHPWMSYEDVRNHPFIVAAQLPPPGDGRAAIDFVERYDGLL